MFESNWRSITWRNYQSSMDICSAGGQDIQGCLFWSNIMYFMYFILLFFFRQTFNLKPYKIQVFLPIRYLPNALTLKCVLVHKGGCSNSYPQRWHCDNSLHRYWLRPEMRIWTHGNAGRSSTDACALQTIDPTPDAGLHHSLLSTFWQTKIYSTYIVYISNMLFIRTIHI